MPNSTSGLYMGLGHTCHELTVGCSSKIAVLGSCWLADGWRFSIGMNGLKFNFLNFYRADQQPLLRRHWRDDGRSTIDDQQPTTVQSTINGGAQFKNFKWIPIKLLSYFENSPRYQRFGSHTPVSTICCESRALLHW